MRYLKNGQTEEEDWKMDQPGLFIKVSYHLYKEVTNYSKEKYLPTDTDKLDEMLEPITYTQKTEIKLPDLVKRSKSETSSVELSSSTTSPNYKRRKFDHVAQIRKTIKVKDCQWGIIEDASEDFISSAESDDEEKLPLNFLDDIEVDQENDWEYLNESFCEAFFISGLPFRNAKLIPDSDNYPAPCHHKVCSSLPAYRSEVINNFPFKEKNQSTFELTQITSALCFPYGIKLCYNQDETQIKPMKNFMTVTTSIKGQRNYIYIYHYFQKVDYFDFKKNYDFDPIKDQFLKNKIVKLINESSQLNDDMNDKKQTMAIERELQDNLMLCSEMINSDFVYLPTAACLVSTHPYSFQMDKSIKAILKTCIDEKLSSYGTFKLLLHLIYEVPIPPDNKRLFFYLPYDSEPIELPGKLFNDLPIIVNGVQTLLEYFSTETMITIHNLMLLEQKLLFIYTDISKLTTITEAFINLLFPFEWTATYIPTLSECLIKYLQSFMPFIMGIESDMLNVAKEYFEEDSMIFLIFVKDKASSVIETSAMYCKSSKKNKRSIKLNLPDFPQVNKAQLASEIEMIRKLQDKERKESKKILNFHDSVDSNSKPFDMKHFKFDKYLRMSFIKSNIRLFGDYENFISCINEFNAEKFLSYKPEKYLGFYREVLETTMFGLLIQNKDNITFFNKMCNKYSSTVITKENYNRRRSKIEETKFKTNLLTKIQRTISSTRVDKKKISIKRRGSLFTIDNKVSAPKTTNVSESCKFIPIVKQKEKIRHMKSQKTLPTLDNDNLSKTSFSNVSLSEEDLDMNHTIVYSETYMISPYYFDNFIMKQDPDNIEEFIEEKFRYANDLNDVLDRKILSIVSQNILPSDVKCKFKRYLIPYTIKRPLSKELTSSEYDTQIAGEILIYFNSIINGSDTKRMEKKDIQRLFRTKSGRRYFGSLIYLDKFNSNDYQAVNEIGFDNLIQMLFTSMLLCLNDPEEFDHIRMMTKSCFCYYKLNGSERYHVYQEVGRSKPFDVWVNQDFWDNWFVHELHEKKENLKDLIVEEVYIMILIELGITMINLNVDIKIVIYIIVEKIGPKYLKSNTKLLGNLEKTLVQQNEIK